MVNPLTKCAHKEADYCVCDSQALEPNDECPIHGAGEFPPRCMYCGCFMPWPKFDESGKRINASTETKED